MVQQGILGDAMGGFGGGLEDGSAQSASGRTLDSLRRRIISLDLPPDTVLSRTELAKEYDVSQTPLRDALQKLESEGLVDIYPQSKTVVTRIDADKIAEALFLRRAVEVEVARELAPTIDQATLSRLRSILGMQEAVAFQFDELTTFQELDESFHQVMFAAVGFPGLHRLIRSRSGHLNRVRRLDMWDEAKIRGILNGHRQIIDALARHDPKASVAAIREHLSHTIARLKTLREQHPAYFKD